jgi:hypothetical protein
MSKTLLSLAAAALLLGGLAVAPASAQTAAPAKKAPAKHAMHHASHMKSCYDYAWDSQQQKDCLAKPAAATAPAKKGKKKKAATS